MPAIKDLEKTISKKTKNKTPYNAILDDKIDKTELTEQELYDVSRYAEILNGMYPSNGGTSFIYPNTINDLMKSINQNPKLPSESELTSALTNPANNENTLRHTSQYFENTLMIYKRLLERNGKLLSFDYTYTPINAKKQATLLTNDYIKDESILFNFLDKFNVKKEFKNITQKLVREDAHFASFRTDSDDKYVLQELPSDYCKITATDEYGFLFDFDMTWFFRYPDVYLSEYPEIFKIWYDRISKIRGDSQAIPSNGKNSRTGASAYWIQLSRADNVWCWKYNNFQIAQIPPLSPLFLDLLNSSEIRRLQKNKYIISASRVLIGLVPLLNDAKSANLKDRVAIDSDTLGKFMYLLRQGLNEAISIGSAPFEDIKEFDFASTNSDDNIQQDHISNIIARQAGIPDLIYPTDKMNATSAKNAIAIEEYVMKYLYPYFADFLYYHVNKLTKRFKFKFVFEGVDTPQSRDRRYKQVKDYASLGIVLPQKFAAAMGMEPHDMIRQMEMASASNFTSKLMSMQSVFNAKSDDKTGRPEVSENDITDAGDNTINADSNSDQESS